VPAHGSEEIIGPEALKAIGELLQAASQYGLGVSFEPDGEGWKVSYIPGKPVWEEYELPSGELSNAYDLHIAALKPLVELGEQAADYFAEARSKAGIVHPGRDGPVRHPPAACRYCLQPKRPGVGPDATMPARHRCVSGSG
jgi:hypothetical protein